MRNSLGSLSLCLALALSALAAELPKPAAERRLGPCPHTIRLRLLADKSEPSGDRYLNVGGFKVLDLQ